MEAVIYNSLTGKEVGKMELPGSVFGVRWNADLVHDVATSALANRRRPIAHAKTRGEVSGGGRKPWRQKGTGRARHGSTRSPLWVGGGVTHGPRNTTRFARSINRKAAAKALAAVLSRKFREGEVLFVDAIATPSGKTKEAKEMLARLQALPGFAALPAKKRNAFVLALAAKDAGVERSFRNFGNAKVNEVRNVGLIDLLTYRYLILENPRESVAVLEGRINKNKKT